MRILAIEPIRFRQHGRKRALCDIAAHVFDVQRARTPHRGKLESHRLTFKDQSKW
jgi:hypothetical protein